MIRALNRCRHIPQILRHSPLCCQQINSPTYRDHDDDDDVDDDDDDNQDGGSIDHRWEEGLFGKRPWMVFPVRPTLERLF